MPSKSSTSPCTDRIEITYKYTWTLHYSDYTDKDVLSLSVINIASISWSDLHRLSNKIGIDLYWNYNAETTQKENNATIFYTVQFASGYTTRKPFLFTKSQHDTLAAFIWWKQKFYYSFYYIYHTLCWFCAFPIVIQVKKWFYFLLFLWKPKYSI